MESDVVTNLGLQDWNTRQCNANAIFQNVLTMTGQSPDLNNPSFLYDSSGLECLDTIQVRGGVAVGVDHISRIVQKS